MVIKKKKITKVKDSFSLNYFWNAPIKNEGKISSLGIFLLDLEAQFLLMIGNSGR